MWFNASMERRLKLGWKWSISNSVILNEALAKWRILCILSKNIIMEKKWYVYILASRKWWVLYTWVTSNIEQRILQHKQWTFDGFSKKYCVHRLVWFQEFPTITEAIEYEKVIKWWKREKKIELIEEDNKEWCDLSSERN